MGNQAPLRVLACGDTGQTYAREITLAFDLLEHMTGFLADPILESLVPIVSRSTSESLRPPNVALGMAWEHIRPHGDIFVGIPHRGQVSTAWAINMLHALSPYLAHIRLFTIQGHPIDVSRDVLVEHALASGAEYIYFLDSDVYTEPDTLLKRGSSVLRPGICSAPRNPRLNPYAS